MKVLHISKFYPPVFGGIESVTWELAEGLHARGVDVHVLCSHQRPIGRYEAAPAGYPVWRCGRVATVLATSIAPAMPPALLWLGQRADIVHVHMPDPMAAAAVWMARPRSRLVVHWHSDVIRQRKALAAYEPLQRWLLARADAIIATSPPYAESSEPLRPWRDKVAVVPIGISDNRDAVNRQRVAELRQQYGGRRLVFALGRATYYKGFDVLIDAARDLPGDCAVLIGGDGELLDTYRHRVAGLGLAGKVHLLGPVPDHELADHFDACDVFCMPSTERAEAYGVAMLEAMVMGKPAVASDIAGSGLPWVNRHGETGYNVPARDPSALAAALRRLLADAALREGMGRTARENYLAHFTAATMTDKTLALYRDVMARRTGAGVAA